MKIKVISDGTRFGTKVISAETGELIEGVIGVSIDDIGTDMPIVTVNFMVSNLNISIGPVIKGGKK